MKEKRAYGQIVPKGKAAAGRKGAPKKKGGKAGTGAKLALAAVTGVNVALTLALHVLRRQDVVHALETDEGVKLLLTAEKRTKSEKR